MDYFGSDLCSDDPILVIVQFLVGKSEQCCKAAENNLRDLGKGVGTQLDDLVHNIKHVSSLKAKLSLNELESVRSGLPVYCESLRLFFVEAIYKRILLTSNKR